MSPAEALAIAEKRALDLVEIAPNADPPVCKIMDFGKFRYEQQKREKLQKKKQQVIIVKEIRFHPNIDTHDFQFKMRHARAFLEEGNKVKVSCVFRGRQMAHQEFGADLLNQLTELLNDIALVEKEPSMEGRAMVIIYAPDKAKKKKADKAKHSAAKAAAAAKTEAEPSAAPAAAPAAGAADTNTHA